MGQYIAPRKESDERETPDKLYRTYDNEFHFTHDVCASWENHKHASYWTRSDDALTRPWSGVCWMNPPYSNVGEWIKKAYEESLRGVTVVCLVTSATDTRWWHEYTPKGEVRFVKGRLCFKGINPKNGKPFGSAPFPSAIVIFRPPLSSSADDAAKLDASAQQPLEAS